MAQIFGKRPPGFDRNPVWAHGSWPAARHLARQL